MRLGSSTESVAHCVIVARLTLLFLLLLSPTAIAQPETPALEFRFQQADFVLSDAETPPQTGWRPQALPDSWLHNRPGVRGIGWYRMRFNLEAVPHEAIGLYVGRMAYTGQIRLNGLVLNPEIRFEQPGERLGDATKWLPYLITLPPGLLRVGDNVVHIRLESFGVGGDGLWDVRLGPVDQLRLPWLVRQIVQQTVPHALTALAMGGSVLGLLVWWRERRPRNLHFAATVVLWTLLLLLLQTNLSWLTLSSESAGAVVGVLLLVFYWALLGLLYRYSASEWHWYPRVLNIVFSLAVLAGLIVIYVNIRAPSPHFSGRMGLVLLPTVAMRLLVTAMLIQAAWRSRTTRSYTLLVAELLWFSGQVQLMCILVGWLPPTPFVLDPTCSLPLFVVLTFFFVDRLVREREQAVHERHAAVSAERGRILQDMHDGLGAQLVVASRLVKRADADRAVVARGIDEALQDLRLIIDCLDADQEGLLSRLASLRHRLEPQLAALGVRLEWDARPSAGSLDLPPQSVLHVLRIVQEALNNAVKHAGATAIGISLAEQDGATVISVTDDGTGFDAVPAGASGRGLSSMRRRAQALGARLDVGRGEGGGTIVSLHMPPVSNRAG